MKQVLFARLIGCGLVILSVLPSRGTAAEPAGITATGHASLKIRPEILRLKIMLTADGKDVREAVSALAQRRERTQKALADLGPLGPVTLEETAIGATNLTPQQRQIQMMMAARQNHAPTTQPQPVTVSCMVSADWQLNPASADEAIVAATELQDKIKAALPKATEDKKPKTPEEQEIADEMAATAASDSSDVAATKPGEPSFIFVHKLTPQERSKVVADAVADAKATAEQLATAAGQQLRSIRQLSLASNATDESNPYASYIQAMTGQSADVSKAPDEATGSQAGAITYSLQISATFDMGN